MIVSLRRRASASTASRASRSRSVATATSEASAGRKRRRTARLDSGALADVERPELPASGAQLEGRLARGRLLRRPEDDPRARGVQNVGDRRREALHLGGGALCLQERRRHLGQESFFPLPLLCLHGSLAGPDGEVAGHDPDDEVHGEREPVLAVRQAERVERRQEEEVEERRARHCNRDCVGAPEQDGHRQHGEEVEDAEAEDGHERLAEIDHARDERERRDAQQSADHPPPVRCLAEHGLDALERAHRRNLAPGSGVGARRRIAG